MHQAAFSKSVSRGIRRALRLFTDDRYALEKISAPILKAGTALPGSPGVFCGQMYLQWTKAARSAEAVSEFGNVLETLGPDSLCIDLGANVGDFTERMADVAGTVHAFEPDPWAFQRLRNRLGHRPNVTLHNAAVGASAGKVTLFRAEGIEDNPVMSYGSSIMPAKRNEPVVEVSVDCVDFCDFVIGLDRNVDLVKMDVEGAEVAILNALLGSPALDRIERLYVETHYQSYPDQLIPVAKLRDAYARLTRPAVNFDWP